jgi:hypothetical protein
MTPAAMSLLLVHLKKGQWRQPGPGRHDADRRDAAA